MTVLVDTSVLIDHLRGNTHDRHYHGCRQRTTCRRVRGREGRGLDGMRTAEEPQDATVLDAIDWIDVDEEIAEQAGALPSQYLRSHPGVDPIDHTIAATAQTFGAELWTTSVKGFPRFPQLASPR